MFGAVSPTARVFDEVELGDDVTICDFAVVGHPRERLVLEPGEPARTTRIGAGTAIFPFAIIYDGARLGAHVVVEERCKIGYEVSIGSRSKIINGAIVHDRAQVGDRCVIGGIVCERAVVGEDSTVMGALLHSHGRPHVPWGEIEPAPTIGSRVVIAHGAAVIGDVSIGHNVYVAASAVVTKSVPPETLVVGMNQQIPAAEWHGSMPDPAFWTWGRPE
jgi:serine acetyltransferase